MSENKKRLIIVALITLFGGLLRFWMLDKLPVSPNWDEVSHGYNAYSILKTGMDEWGRSFPLIFRAFGDYKLPLYIYLTVLPVALFGLNVFAIRFISSLAGTLAIPGIYLVVKELFPQKNTDTNLYKSIPIISSILLAISPWHFFISRPALEANLALTLTIFGAYCLIRFINKKSSLLPSSVLFGLALQTYNTERVFVPLLLLVSIFIFGSSLRGVIAMKQSQIKNIIAIIFFSASLMLVGTQVLSGEGSARYEKLKILSPSVVFQIGEARQNSTLPSLISKAIHNRPLYFVTTAAKNYFSYFSPQFFYQTWGAQFQFAIPGQNLLTLPVYLLSIIGLILVITKIKGNNNYLFILSWLLLSPIAGSLTADPPQALRPNPMIPALVIMASLGLYFILEKISKKYATIVFVGVGIWVIISFSIYFNQYSSDYKNNYSLSWQYGYSQVMEYISQHKSEYEKIFITKRYGEPHIFYSFYTHLDPKQLQPGEDNIRYSKSDWFWTDKIGNVYFVNDWQIPLITVNSLPLENGEVVSTARSLLITSPDHVPVNAHLIETINFLDGSPAFIITSVP